MASWCTHLVLCLAVAELQVRSLLWNPLYASDIKVTLLFRLLFFLEFSFPSSMSGEGRESRLPGIPRSVQSTVLSMVQEPRRGSSGYDVCRMVETFPWPSKIRLLPAA